MATLRPFDKNNKKNISNTKMKVSNGIKDSILNSSRDTQNMAGSININVNNLIINNNPEAHPNSNYNNNYGLYLPNSSVFSKIGSDIMNSGQLSFNNSQMNSSQMSGISAGKLNESQSKKTHQIPSVIVQNYNKTPLNSHSSIKVNFNSLNNILNANPGIGNMNNIKPNIGHPGKDKKFIPNNIPNNSSTINLSGANIIQSRQNMLDSSAKKKKNIIKLNPYSEVASEKVNVNKDVITSNTNNLTNNNNPLEQLNVSLNKLQIDNLIGVTDEVLDRHVYIWDLIFDFEILCDNKNALSSITKNLISEFKHFEKNKINLEIFSNSTLNKPYTKILKICLIILIYNKFILLDFNYETNIKVNLKKVFSSLNEQLLSLIDSFVISEKFPRDFLEKFSKLLLSHKIKKNKENLNTMTIYKNLELVINNVKQFSNNYFKIGYFKPIHSICVDFFKLVDSLSLTCLLNMVIDHVLFYPLNFHKDVEKKSVTTKTLVFSPVSFFGIPNNIQIPFLPPVGSSVYTLFLDLDETLYADNILDVIDKEGVLIKHRLYRHHTSIAGMSFVKDLSKSGRDLSKCIIIDNLPENFKLQQNNGLFIKTWNDDMRDTQLFDFIKILKDLVVHSVPDIRVVLKKLKDEVNKRIKKNATNPYSNIEVLKFL